MRRLLIVLFVASVTLFSCDRKEMMEYTQEEQSYIKQNNDLAFSVIKYLQEVDSSENVVFSPLVLMTNLSLAANGASGETLDEFKKMLGVQDINLDVLNSFCKKVINNSTVNDSVVSIYMGNFIAINHDREILDSYLDVAKDYYDAEVESMDFSSASSVERINKWCSDLTHGMIPRCVDGLNSNDILCMLSSIYFKGQWRIEDLFEKKDTELEEFVNEQGEKSMVPIMKAYYNFDYYKGDNFASVSIPYKGGYDFVVMLPDEGTKLKTMANSFNQLIWEKMLAQYTDTNEVRLRLPRFDIEFNRSFNDILKRFGIVSAFDPVKAKVERMCKEKVFISDVKQRSIISVNEEGTHAASSYSETVTLGIEPEPIEFLAKRPFLYAIKESATGAILFMGLYQGEK